MPGGTTGLTTAQLLNEGYHVIGSQTPLALTASDNFIDPNPIYADWMRGVTAPHYYYADPWGYSHELTPVGNGLYFAPDFSHERSGTADLWYSLKPEAESQVARTSMNGVSGFVFDSNSFDLSQAITPGRNNSAYAEKKSGLGGLGALGAIAALAAAVYTGGAALGAWGAAEGAAGAGLVAAETAEAATLGASLATEAGGSFLGNGITGSMFANSAAAVPGFTAETLGAGLSTMQATGLGAAQYVGLGAASASAIPTVAEVLNYARQGVSTAQTASRLFSSPSPSSGIAGLSSGLSLSGVPGKAGYSSGFSDFMGIGMPQATRAGNGIFPQDTGAAASGLDLSTLALGFVAIAGVLYFAKGL